MSIVPLERVTFVGITSEREQLLDDLHERGCLELIPLGAGASSSQTGGATSQATEALRFLLTCPQHQRQESEDTRFNAAEVEQKTLELQSQLLALESERDELLLRLQTAKPWGDFQFPPLEKLAGNRLWFYVVPHKDMPQVEAGNHVWNLINRDQRFSYVVIVSNTEPDSMPVPREPVGSRSPGDMARRLEEVELAIGEIQAERAYLTRWCTLFARSLARLDDAAARAGAAQQTLESGPLFALEAWVPQERVPELEQYSSGKGFVFESRLPAVGENPPTLMRNTPRTEVGEDLVNFYMTPGYWTWDPSGIVLVSFAIFFGMILADAGYAALLGLGLLVYWRRLGQSETGQRFRPMLLLILTASLAYGVLVGSYFGVTPPDDSLLGRFHLLDMNNSSLMMGISVLVGGIHVVLANIMDARRHPDWIDRLASVGWAAAVGGGLLAAAGTAVPSLLFLKYLGFVAVFLGLLFVFGYTAPREKPVNRMVQGLLGLTKISAAFGDILSYLRLFALGLASASLALAFNDMAAGIRSGMPRVGLLLALMVLVFGHALNLLLGVSSGVIHGLRLNVIEFFNWGLKDEGRRFTPFRRKEDSLWK